MPIDAAYGLGTQVESQIDGHNQIADGGGANQIADTVREFGFAFAALGMIVVPVDRL